MTFSQAEIHWTLCSIYNYLLFKFHFSYLTSYFHFSIFLIFSYFTDIIMSFSTYLVLLFLLHCKSNSCVHCTFFKCKVILQLVGNTACCHVRQLGDKLLFAHLSFILKLTRDWLIVKLINPIPSLVVINDTFHQTKTTALTAETQTSETSLSSVALCD